MIRAVLDTNIVISGLLWGGLPSQIFVAASQERFEALMSEPLLNELSVTLRRSKFTAQLNRHSRTVEDILRFYRAMVQFIEPAPVPENIVRDPKDRMVLACAVGGRADYIVSGDKDLLVLGEYEAIPILSVDQFLRQLSD